MEEKFENVSPTLGMKKVQAFVKKMILENQITYNRENLINYAHQQSP